VPEGQRLEFKRKSNPDRPDLNADDRKNLGESLSAFSNAEDGVVLWASWTSAVRTGWTMRKNRSRWWIRS